MSYWLGIDVGTTFTAAAVCRGEVGRRAVPEVVPLGSRSSAVSSVVYLGADGQVVVGEAAERRVVTDPDRVVREFKRRIGDEVPMVVGGVPYSAPEISALVVRWVVDRVAEREGEPAQGITVTHPASWGAYKTRIMADALGAAGLPEVMFCTEPEAAAASYSVQERVATGSTIAVYDLGGGTFDAAVVRKTDTSTFSVLGVPQGIERLGGVDFDEAVFGHVVDTVPALGELDPESAATLAATARLRRECTEAKEALSADTEVTISVLLPEVQSQVRLVRAEFEDLIRPQVVETVEALRRALHSAGVGAEDLDAVLLVGGSSRVPLVTQLVSAEFGRPVAVDADPTAAIALGAALSALPADTDRTAEIDTTGAADVAPDTPVPTAVGATPAAGFPGSDVPEPVQVEAPNRPGRTATPLDEPADVEWRRARSRRYKRLAAASLLALTLAGGAAAVPIMTSRIGPLPPADAGTPATVTPAIPATTIPAAPNPASGADNDNGNDGPRREDPAGAVRRTPHATPHNPPGGAAKPAPAVVPPPAPPLPWTRTWTTSWSKPPPTTTAAPPPTTPPPAATTTKPRPTAATTRPQPTATTSAPTPATTPRARPGTRPTPTTTFSPARPPRTDG